MCRFLVYAGEPILLHDLLYRPAHSIVKQGYAANDAEDRVNADGFGVAWYAPEIAPTPAVLRSVRPIWTHAGLKSISAHVRSALVFAHARAASDGLEVAEANCHPFAFGRLLWMHNGTVGGHVQLRDWVRRFVSSGVAAQIRGTTDSELVFALFLELWSEAAGDGSSQPLVSVLQKTIRFLEDWQRDTGVTEPTTLNLALTDGETVVAVRHAWRSPRPPLSLFLAECVRPRTLPGGLSWEATPVGGAVLVASEPLSGDAPWREVSPGTAVVLGPDRKVKQVAL